MNKFDTIIESVLTEAKTHDVKIVADSLKDAEVIFKKDSFILWYKQAYIISDFDGLSDYMSWFYDAELKIEAI